MSRRMSSICLVCNSVSTGKLIADFGGRANGMHCSHSSSSATSWASPVSCMEPMNATALYTADKCEVWGPTQNGEGAFAAALAASGLPADKCDVHKVHLGGGFGR